MLTIHNIAFQVRKAPGVDPRLAPSCSQLCALVAPSAVAVLRMHAHTVHCNQCTNLQLVALHAVTSTDAACAGGRLVVLQGWMTPDVLSRAGLDAEALAQPHLMLDDTRPGFRPGTHDVCLMRGGVVFSDRVTTVSPTYACEVYRPEFGFGMQVGRVLSGSRSGTLSIADNCARGETDPRANGPRVLCIHCADSSMLSCLVCVCFITLWTRSGS